MASKYQLINEWNLITSPWMHSASTSYAGNYHVREPYWPYRVSNFAHPKNIFTEDVLFFYLFQIQ